MPIYYGENKKSIFQVIEAQIYDLKFNLKEAKIMANVRKRLLLGNLGEGFVKNRR